MWASKSPSSHQNLLMLIFLSFFIDMLQLPFQQPRCEVLSHPGQQGAYLRDQRCGALANSLARGISFRELCWLSGPTHGTRQGAGAPAAPVEFLVTTPEPGSQRGRGRSSSSAAGWLPPGPPGPTGPPQSKGPLGRWTSKHVASGSQPATLPPGHRRQCLRASLLLNYGEQRTRIHGAKARAPTMSRLTPTTESDLGPNTNRNKL